MPLTIELVALGFRVVVTKGADVVPMVPNGVPEGNEARFGTAKMAAKIVPPSLAEAAVLMESTCAADVSTK